MLHKPDGQRDGAEVKRRLITLIFGDWLPPFHGFVAQLPRSRSLGDRTFSTRATLTIGVLKSAGLWGGASINTVLEVT